MSRESRTWRFVVAPILVGALPQLTGCGGGGSAPGQAASTFTRVQQVFLVSDVPGLAKRLDPNLVNPSGIAFGPTGPFWIADNNSGKSTQYNGSGAVQPFVVDIASPSAPTGGAATGQVYNGTPDFKLGDGKPATFIYATEDGTIAAWSGYTGKNAVIRADRSIIPDAAHGAVYKGLAIGATATGNFLYATNFRAATIDVFDKNFVLASQPGSFIDPNLPVGFAPFGIQNVEGELYVTYAKQDAAKHDDIAGAGNGLINVFDTNGALIRRFATGTTAGGESTDLNSPWGLAVAPANFGPFGNSLLVGNFGDGHISAFNRFLRIPRGQLKYVTGHNPVTIPGLWGISFGNGAAAGSASVLYFTAGIGDPTGYKNNLEHHGLFGSLTSTSQ